MNFLRRLSSFIEYVSRKFLILLLATMMSLIGLSVVGRSYTFMSVTWCQEVSNMCFIWLGFLGASLGVKHKSHFTVNIVASHLNAARRIQLNFFVDLSLMVLAAVMFYFGIQFTKMGGLTISAMTGITFFWTYISIPVSSALIIVYLIEDILISVQGIKSAAK